MTTIFEYVIFDTTWCKLTSKSKEDLCVKFYINAKEQDHAIKTLSLPLLSLGNIHSLQPR